MNKLDLIQSSRVMVVDDLHSIRADLVRILTELGFTQITECADGLKAWEVIREEATYGKPFNLMFLDIMMPGLNGVTLLRSVRQMTVYKKIPIFMVTTENEKETIIKCVSYGASDYVLKPYHSKTIKEKVLAKL